MTATVDDEFLRQADPFRRELLAHCYRMTGSVHDAEDLVQETYLRAWKAYDRFEGRSSLRTWLYTIATRTCLTALDGRGRRPLPAGLGGPSGAEGDLLERREVPWLEPVPDALVDDPAVLAGTRDSVRLAFVAALQHLPSRQRAVLVLRDVLKWRAAEVGELLGMSVAAVNSSLQRAHAQLADAAPTEDGVQRPTEARQRELLERYVKAFEAKDIPALLELFTADTVWEMPPFAAWYRGAGSIGRHLDLRCPGKPGGIRMVPVRANGQPGYAQYFVDGDGVYQAFLLQVLTVTFTGISHVVNFLDTGIFTAFDLPRSLPA